MQEATIVTVGYADYAFYNIEDAYAFYKLAKKSMRVNKYSQVEGVEGYTPTVRKQEGVRMEGLETYTEEEFAALEAATVDSQEAEVYAVMDAEAQ